MKTSIRIPQQSRNRIKNPRKYLSRVFDSFVRSYDIRDAQAALLSGNLQSGSFGSAVKVASEIGSKIYANPHEHLCNQQLASFVKKVPFEEPSLDPVGSAWKKFQAAEHRCRRANQRFNAERRVGRENYAEIRRKARGWIERVIGLSPNIPEIYEECDFGPGASIGIHGTATHRAAKLENETWSVTPTALCYARSVMGGNPLIWELLQQRSIFSLDPALFIELFDRKATCVGANKIIMVPKTAMVHRTIAIEPLLNGLLQKGVDAVLKKRLRRFGIDLEKQDRNQALARLGSILGFNPFVTIDLASASDTICIGVVKDLLPPDWFAFLNNIRSPSYESEWGNGRYHKFTSMGNGFCFPLETLIFASLAYAVGTETGDADFCIYGDDIIVHQRSALYLLEILKYMGFTANSDKTFLFGPFRESCGADFFEGVPVRPYNLDFIPKTDQDIYKVYNGMLRRHPDLDQSVRDVILSPIPLEERLYRPVDGPPAGAATVAHDVFMGCKHAKWNKDYQSWSWVEFVETGLPDLRRPSSAVEMYGALRGQKASNSDHRVEFTFRRRTKIKLVRVPGNGTTAAPEGLTTGRQTPFLELEWRIATSLS